MILTRRRRFAWRAVGAFIKVLKNIPWFRRIGHPLSQEERAAATLCAKSLGFTAEPVELTSWSEAADIAHALYSQSSWSEEEENISNDIAQSVLKIFNLDQVQVMTTQVQAEATPLIVERVGSNASMWGFDDDQAINAAVGASVKCCCSVMHLMSSEYAGNDLEKHYLGVKFKLFELGRWPLGVLGHTFYIF